ncbi:MAG: hypothetical protein ACOX0C_02405 [Patescibacteria group bacterium]|jgi:Ca2+/Na+ antiporter
MKDLENMKERELRFESRIITLSAIVLGLLKVTVSYDEFPWWKLILAFLFVFFAANYVIRGIYKFCKENDEEIKKLMSDE